MINILLVLCVTAAPVPTTTAVAEQACGGIF